MTDAPDTRDRVIDAAITLMRRSGFSGAGINEILKESGAPKGSLYHFFPRGKRQIVSEAMAVYSQRTLALYGAALSKADAPGEKVRRLFQIAARRLEESSFRQSCAGGAVSLDLDAELEVVRLAVSRYFEDWIDLLSEHFEFADRRRARSFGGLVLTAIQGGYIRGRAEHSTRPLKEAGEWLARVAEEEAAR